MQQKIKEEKYFSSFYCAINIMYKKHFHAHFLKSDDYTASSFLTVLRLF